MWLLQLICTFGLITAAANAQTCDEFDTVTNKSSRDYLGQNVTLFCSADARDTRAIVWKVELEGATIQNVYRANPHNPSDTYPYPGFENNVTGEFVHSYAYNHSLTILDTGPGFNNSIWTCKVTTGLCYVGKDSPPEDLELRIPFLRLPKLYDSDNNEIEDNKELKKDTKISCQAESDPESVMSFSGEGIEEEDGDSSCELRSDGDFFLCSVTATVKSGGTVQCKATFLGEETCAGGDCSSKGLTILVAGVLAWWIILLIVLAVAAVIVVVIVLGVYIYKEKNPNPKPSNNIE